MRVRCLDAVEIRESGAARRQVFACPIEQPESQGLCHAGAAVVGRAASETHDDLLDALVQRRRDELAGAVAGGLSYVQFISAQSQQARRGRALDHAPASGEHSPQRVDASHQRVVCGRGASVTTEGGEQRVGSPRPAVGHRQGVELPCRVRGAEAIDDRRRGLNRGQGAL